MVENLSIKNDEQTGDGEKENEPAQNTEGFLEKVEKRIENPSISVSDQDDTGLVAQNTNPPAPTYTIPDDAIILPATQSAFIEGEKAETKMSVKWLRIWCKYMIDKYGSKVFFKGE